MACWRCIFVLGLSLVLAASGAHASDGVIEINQAAALAGGVTPGDAPGFPVTISAEGSFQLTGNLTVSDPNSSAIVINADAVTLDLSGFAIRGSWVVGTGCSVAPGGVAGVTSANEGVVVRRGRIVDMPGSGVFLGSFARVEGVAAVRNCQNGIQVGELGQVIDSQAVENHIGIRALAASRVAGSQAIRNREFGIAAEHDSIVTQSVAVSSGITGIVVGAGSLVLANVASLNGGSGIQASDGTLALQNAANANGVVAFYSGWGYNGTARTGAALNGFNDNRQGSASNGVAIGCNYMNGAAVCPP